MTFDCGDNGPGWDGPILCNECFSFGSPTPGCDSQLRGLCGDALAVSKVSGGPVFCACVDSAVDAGTCL